MPNVRRRRSHMPIRQRAPTGRKESKVMHGQMPGPGCGWPRHRSGTKVLTSHDEGQLSAYDASTTVEGVVMRTCDGGA
jgi:hypothetical protein